MRGERHTREISAHDRQETERTGEAEGWVLGIPGRGFEEGQSLLAAKSCGDCALGLLGLDTRSVPVRVRRVGGRGGDSSGEREMHVSCAAHTQTLSHGLAYAHGYVCVCMCGREDGAHAR